jgi:hypothetical protein
MNRMRHTYGLFVQNDSQWHSFRAVCTPTGMEMRIRANYDLDEDDVDNWRVWVMEDYEERTGLEIGEA